MTIKNSLAESKESEAQHIVNESIPDKNSPENVAKFKACIEAFGNLIDKGAAFYPSIKASEEIKPLFPDFNALSLIESKLKLLNKGDETKEDKD